MATARVARFSKAPVMLPGPVFNLELRRLSRRKRYYALLTLYGLVLLYAVWSNNPQSMFVVPAGPAGGLSADQWQYAGKSVFEAYAISQMAMVVLLTPAMVAGVIAVERERKTMSGLLVSGLTSGEIVLGKLCSRLFHLGCFVALGMPILVLVERFGGVGVKGVLFTFLATATTAFFLGAASILVSTQARRARDAIVCMYLLVFLWHIIPAFVLIMTSSNLFAPLRMAVQWLASTCPLLVMIGGVRGVRFWEPSNLDDLVWMIAYQLALGVVMTTVAVRRLRPAFLKDESKQQSVRAGERDLAAPENNASQSTPRKPEPPQGRSWLNANSADDASPAVELAPPEPGQTEPQPAPIWRRPGCGNDAMIWKEVWTKPKSRMTRVLRGLVLATMLTLAAVFCFGQGLESVQELFENGYSAEYEDLYHRLELNVRLRYLVTLTAGFMLLWVSIVAACSLAGERDRDTWVSLLSTPLTGFEIIRGKAIGAFWSARWLLAVWLALVMMGVLVGAVHPLGALAVTLATATYLAFGCVLGMVYSLRARTSSRAVVSTLLTLVILSGAYLLVFMPWNLRSELTLVGVTPFVEEVVLMSYLDVKWLLDFESPEQRMLNIGLTCALSVALYAGSAFVLALWALKSFDRVIDRPGSTTAAGRRPPFARRQERFP
jgi:ABC-type transport system involved in multi-copper enzyme maturation permease subunit